jgi:LmbE family N-acetylglucosaminyl deacetylase
LNSLLLSPHDDDSALFAAFTCLREHPTVVVVAGSYVQPARGETGCSAEERAAETAAAHEILGCPVIRCGLRDDDLTLEQIIGALRSLPLPKGEGRGEGEGSSQNPNVIYTPALEGGHPQHDLVTIAAALVFGSDRLRCYSTYAQHSRYFGVDLHPIGTQEIEWTRDEYERKERALSCYASQLRVNPAHFEAVRGRSEWLSGYHRLHLGCGEQEKRGWINVDRVEPKWAALDNSCFFKADFAEASQTIKDADGNDVSVIFLGIPVADNAEDYVFSEDVLEHIPPERRVDVLNEIWRVLVPGGLMEHYIPNAGSQNDFGSLSHLSHWNLQCFDHVDVKSKRWESDHTFEGFVGGFTKVKAELVNWRVEEDGVKRAQSLHVVYRAVKP